MTPEELHGRVREAMCLCRAIGNNDHDHDCPASTYAVGNVADLVRVLLAEEREACAQIGADVALNGTEVAAAIRARSAPRPEGAKP